MATTKPDCLFFAEGRCTKGDACEFRHCEAAKYATQECAYAYTDSCKKSDCPYWHPQTKPSAASGNTTKVPCYYFSIGQCRNGDSCNFLHDPASSTEPAQGAPGAESASGAIGEVSDKSKEDTLKKDLDKNEIKDRMPGSGPRPRPGRGHNDKGGRGRDYLGPSAPPLPFPFGFPPGRPMGPGPAPWFNGGMPLPPGMGPRPWMPPLGAHAPHNMWGPRGGPPLLLRPPMPGIPMPGRGMPPLPQGAPNPGLKRRMGDVSNPLYTQQKRQRDASNDHNRIEKVESSEEEKLRRLALQSTRSLNSGNEKGGQTKVEVAGSNNNKGGKVVIVTKSEPKTADRETSPSPPRDSSARLTKRKASILDRVGTTSAKARESGNNDFPADKRKRELSEPKSRKEDVGSLQSEANTLPKKKAKASLLKQTSVTGTDSAPQNGNDFKVLTFEEIMAQKRAKSGGVTDRLSEKPSLAGSALNIGKSSANQVKKATPPAKKTAVAKQLATSKPKVSVDSSNLSMGSRTASPAKKSEIFTPVTEIKNVIAPTKEAKVQSPRAKLSTKTEVTTISHQSTSSNKQNTPAAVSMINATQTNTPRDPSTASHHQDGPDNRDEDAAAIDDDFDDDFDKELAEYEAILNDGL